MRERGRIFLVKEEQKSMGLFWAAKNTAVIYLLVGATLSPSAAPQRVNGAPGSEN